MTDTATAAPARRAALIFVFFTVLIDRFGRRRVILISCFGLAVDFAFMALAQTLPMFFIGRVVSALTSASFSTANAYLADVTPPERRAAAFGLLGSAFGIGFVVGPALGGLLGGIDLRLPFWIASGLALLNFAYGLFVLPESLPSEKRSPRLDLRRANPVGAPLLLESAAGGPGAGRRGRVQRAGAGAADPPAGAEDRRTARGADRLRLRPARFRLAGPGARGPAVFAGVPADGAVGPGRSVGAGHHHPPGARRRTGPPAGRGGLDEQPGRHRRAAGVHPPVRVRHRRARAAASARRAVPAGRAAAWRRVRGGVPDHPVDAAFTAAGAYCPKLTEE